MADKEDKTEIQAADVASLSIAEILGQLHENAANKCGAQSKGVKVTNSAVDVDGGKAKLSSAGEHIISVLPLKAGDPVEKNVAVEVLQAYVQWFVGPDLAKKINDSTVKSLLESPGNEVKQKAESKKPFMSFKQFLNEAEDKDDGSNNSTAADVSFGDDDKDRKDDSPNNSTANDVSFSDGNEDGSVDKKDDTKQAKEDAELDKKKAGYYIPYSLKVEGLPQTALKDAVKKFAKTFFDDVKIYGSGLFGGSYSFTVKDVKDAFRSAFGPIDPDDLVQQVENRIEKLYKGSSRPEVNIQEKDTLISDLGNQINAAQKKQISDANYSLFIQVDEDDPKKPIFNPRVIADIVQSSITGLFKKFKNKITKNDVIYIPDYQDTHKDSQKVRDLYNSVPDNNQIYTLIDKADNAATAWSRIEDALDKKVKKHNQYKNCNRAVQCVKAWEDFKKEHVKDAPETRAALNGNEKEKYFKSFLANYEKAFKDTQDKSIESTVNECVLSSVKINEIVFKLMLESFIGEDDNDESKKTFKANANEIKAEVINVLKAYHMDGFGNNGIIVGTKDSVLKKLKNYDTSNAKFTDESGEDKKEFNNAILACESTETLSESFATNDSLKSSIMSILFEKDKESASTSKKSLEEIAQDLKGAFTKALESFGITDFADSVLIFHKQKLNESMTLDEKTKKNANSSSSDNDVAYVFPFGSNAKVEMPSTGDDAQDNSSDTTSHSVGKQDAYVIPMKGLAYEDPEYATTNLK